MFIVEDNPSFTHTVTVKVPVDGGHRADRFRATFLVISAEERDGFDLDTVAGSTQLLQRIVVGLDDVAGPDKKPIPYCDELRDRLIAIPYVRAALAEAYFAALSGAQVGN